MSKKEKKEVELYKEEEIEASEKTPSRKLVKRVMSFDVYFQLLMKKTQGIQAHHKAPMKKYVELKGLKEATEEEFDRILRVY